MAKNEGVARHPRCDLGPERLPSADAREIIADRANTIHVSVASIGEIAIERALGRGDTPALSSREAVSAFRAAGYALLDVTPDHAVAVEALPLLHADPFDRLLVAQALVEPLRLLTYDRQVGRYGGGIIFFQ